ncbi:alpha/beta fold hydrolase [Bowmanella dokdonensis]|uniref:Alpha/beta fold hydrolase n=2 Tax=Bowmanella dokdonensis TaxID=751969 RepID=A0A939IPT9_9ALTE|nr:alpha/beta fold hydrolase [Bowmanella dokdonensis]
MDYYFSDEQTLRENYPTLIQGFWHNQVQTGTFKGREELDIAYAYSLHPEARGTIVISSGRIEGYLKYKEILFDLYQNRYSVFILDHRGQGLSERMNDHAHQGYVRHYDDYVADLKQFYDQIVLPNSRHKPVLLGHSMGSAIGTLYLSAYPQDFSKAAFSSPMYGIKSPLPLWLARGLVSSGQSLNRWFASRPWYFIGQGDYLAVPFAINTLTHSKIRYQIFRDEYEQTPRLQLGGVTFDWLQASLDALDRLEDLAPELQTEILVLQAGGDLVVDNGRQDHLCALMPRCQLRVIAKARHELLMEADPYRTEAMTRILDFFQAE